jgi:hypothetical protein
MRLGGKNSFTISSTDDMVASNVPFEAEEVVSDELC